MTVESVVWDEWYPVAIAEDVTPCKVYKTRLLGHSIEYACDAAGRQTAWRDNAERTPCAGAHALSRALGLAGRAVRRVLCTARVR